MDQLSRDPAVPAEDRLPMAGLLALAMAGFMSILTEALPAGLLPHISRDLGISESLAGQMVSVCAIGSLVSTIPLSVATLHIRRRPLFLFAIGGFIAVNAVTALASSYVAILVARFFAGVFVGLLWALLARYASRMAPDHLTGRAIAIAMIGEPLALLIGMPGGTFLGTTIGWRSAFGLLGVLAVILIGWVLWKVPDFPGQADRSRPSVAKVMAIPGIGAVLFVTVTLVLADATLYVYIAPFLAPSGLAGRTDLVLFVFGAAALIGIWIVGALIDKRLRGLMLLSSGVFLIAAVMLGLYVHDAAIVFVAVAIWGLGYGGVGTLLQTACGRAAGPSADVAQSIFVTCWNGAIAGGGVLGGILLSHYGAEILPWSLVALLVPTLLAVWFSRNGFART